MLDYKNTNSCGRVHFGTTIKSNLYKKAKSEADRLGVPVNVLIEEGLELALEKHSSKNFRRDYFGR